MVLSVIAEYNPFHNGHRYHLNESRRISGCKYAVAVMSGNFVQRGEPAAFDKYIRARAALNNGADLVVELPVCYACASAEYFAKGAVKLIQQAGVSDCLSFGSESGDINALEAVAKFLYQNSGEYVAALQKHLKTGVSFPAARKTAVEAVSVSDLDAGPLDRPNDTLGVEYIKAARSIGYKTRFMAVKRAANLRVNPGALYTSASASRAAVYDGCLDDIKNAVPADMFQMIEQAVKTGNGPYVFNNLSPLLHFIVKTRGVNYIKNIFETAEGLENRIVRSTGKYYQLKDIITDIKTKRYTLTKINRILLHIILNLTKNDYEMYERAGGPQYIRVLGFRKKSADLLNMLEKKAGLPVIMNLKKDIKKLPPLAEAMLKKEIECGNIFYLANIAANNDLMERDLEYGQPLVIV